MCVGMIPIGAYMCVMYLPGLQHKYRIHFYAERILDSLADHSAHVRQACAEWSARLYFR
jgi:hypothetical protein